MRLQVSTRPIPSRLVLSELWLQCSFDFYNALHYQIMSRPAAGIEASTASAKACKVAMPPYSLQQVAQHAGV